MSEPPDSIPEDVFVELARLLSPERLLGDSRANGQGIRICVVDSGIEQSILQQKYGPKLEPIAGGIFLPDRPEPLPYLGHQSSPHGTTVADIILTFAPRAQLYSADVFGPRGTCEVEQVIRALNWAVEVWKCKIVNLSLGISEQRLQQIPRRFQLLHSIEEAYYRDVIVVAAAHNEHPLTRSYPAVFAPPLLSVDRSTVENPWFFAYKLREHIEFQAFGRGYLGPTAQEPATSWAAPHLAGLAARLLTLRPNLKPFEVKTLLYWLSQHPPKPLP